MSRVCSTLSVGSPAYALKRDAPNWRRAFSPAPWRCTRTPASVPFYQAKRDDETLELIRAQLDETAFNRAWEEGRALTVDEAVALALGDAD